MPAQQKKLIFCTAGVLSLACALGTAAAVGTQLWVRGSILCSTGALLVNASGPELHKFIGHIQYGLFAGQRVRQCGLGGRPFQFSSLQHYLYAVKKNDLNQQEPQERAGALAAIEKQSSPKVCNLRHSLEERVGEAVWEMLADLVPDTQNVKVSVMASLCIHNLLISKDKKTNKKRL